MPHLTRWLLLLLLCLPSGAVRADAAEALERRLLAPCCYQQTLDIHASDPASALRQEIRARLRRGESSANIERDMVQRYGERVLAVPAESPLESLALAGLGIIFLAVAVIGWRARRWTRATNADALDDDPHYDAELRAALDALDPAPTSNDASRPR